VRISGGAARGIPLTAPRGDAVRPATDGLRQAVFSSLAARVPGARFLDLFAGSGAYGLEAISRGASAGMFVEKNAKAAACLRRNLAAVCKSAGVAEAAFALAEVDALSWLPEPVDATGILMGKPNDAPPPDLVFIDPPYELIGDVAPKLFARLSAALTAKPDPVIVFEMPGELALDPAGWTCVRRLGKGARQPTAAFFRKTSAC
jgi:16S rRNA (guanine966-N2)-methyltransferase